MKRVQSAVNRGVQGKSISLTEVRDFVYGHPNMAEKQIVKELIDQLNSSALVIPGSQQDETKDETVNSLGTLPHLPTPKGGTLSRTSESKENPSDLVYPIDLLKATQDNFTNESDEVKSEIVRHLTQQTIRSAKDLKLALQKVRNTELALFRQIYSDHTSLRRSELSNLKGTLAAKSQQEATESENFHRELDLELNQTLIDFGVSI
jgi:hypothetical protein